MFSLSTLQSVIYLCVFLRYILLLVALNGGSCMSISESLRSDSKLSASSRIKKKGLKILISISRHVLPVGCAPSESTGVGCTGAAEDAWTLGVPKLNPPKGCWAAAGVWVARPPKLKPAPADEAPRVMLVVAGWDAAGVLSFGREALDAKKEADFSN